MLNTSHQIIRAAALAAFLLPAAYATPQASSQTKPSQLPANPQPIRLHPANPHYFLFRGKGSSAGSQGGGGWVADWRAAGMVLFVKMLAVLRTLLEARTRRGPRLELF